jgi:phosphate transport system substrate-binding protein
LLVSKEITTFRLENQNPTPMKTKFYFLIAGIILLFAACNSKTSKQTITVLSHSNQITISGANALAPIMQVWMAEYQKTHPYIKFKLTTNGSGEGLNELLAGKVDLAMISEEIPKKTDSIVWVAPVARLAVVPVMNAKNPFLKTIQENGMTKDNLIDLFTGKKQITWGELIGKPGKDKVTVYMRGDSSGASTTLANFLAINPKELKGITVNGEDELIKQVKKDQFALSYCNFIYVFDPVKKEFLSDLKVVPIILNEKEKQGGQKIFDSYEHLQRAMWLGKYPSSLIRNLSLVSKGKPRTREMVDFIYWIVTDGQKFIPDNGYIELHSSDVQNLVTAMKAMVQ